jgi:hypothetical protein
MPSFSDDARTVVEIARRTIGNPDLRAARAASDDATRRVLAACHQRQPAEVQSRLAEEARAARLAYFRLKGGPIPPSLLP